MKSLKPYFTLRRVIASVTLTALVTASVFITRPASASVLGARVAASVLFDELRANGWNVRDCYSSGLLRYGQSTVISTTLYAENDYTFAAAGCEDARDVDIAVYDEDGNLVARDNDASVLAVAEVSPIWSGTFYVKVTMYNSVYDGAHYVLQYAWTRK